ncbi:excinuclease ABC subunit UvrA [Alienimonas californiensis]|uniref:UvrABC system protein A n=1 Tax=Alienimonas californiensis TaxID=2527989 RepID=A0A517P9M2_9PLAN|nr:hypothetical protein [Alienimonas californiensis]QDT16069.1 UvrABC system protein A [Alienimonas californiensis]
MSAPTAPPIRLRGVRVRALRIDALDLPRGGLTVVAGVSGSGKSTLLRDVLHAEGQRRYVAALSASARRLLERRERPDADEISGVPPAILVDPDQPPGRGETLADRAGLGDVLRTAFAALATPHDPTTGAPLAVTRADLAAADLIAARPNARGQIAFPADAALSADAYRGAGFNRYLADAATGRLEDAETLPSGAEIIVDRVKLSADAADRIGESLAAALRFGGGRATVWLETEEGPRTIDGKRWAPHVVRDRPVLDDGTVLPPATPRLFSPSFDRKDVARRAYRVDGQTWDRWVERSAADLRTELPADGPPAVAALAAALERLANWGLADRPLGEPAAALSRADDRRAALAAAADPGVRGLLVLLDAPLAGLEEADGERFLALCRSLTDGGNTVVAAGSESTLCRAAALLVELGPGAGPEGGRVLFAGPPGEIGTVDGSLLAPYLRADPPPVPSRPAPSTTLPDADRTPFVPRGLTLLVGPDADRRLHALADAATAATADGRFGAFGAVLFGPRAPLTNSPRSTVATFLGFFGEIRDLFASTPEAKLRGFGPGHFSLAGASPGRCPLCEGTGTVTTPMQFLPDLTATCPECGGDRFKPEILAIRVRGLSIAGTLNLTAAEAVPFFRGRPKPRARAAAVRDVGLGHVTIGRAAKTLSDGEGQRLRLAKTLAARTAAATLILLEAPAAGLHPADAERLGGVFERLTENGHAVIASGSHPRLRAAADAEVRVG